MSSLLKQSGYLLASAFALGLSLHSAASVYVCVSAHAHHARGPVRACLHQAASSLKHSAAALPSVSGLHFSAIR